VPVAINLTLDTETALAVESAYARLTGMGVADRDLVTQYGPCVTLLVVADTVHPDDIAEGLHRRLPALNALAVTLGAPFIAHGSTPPTLALAVDAGEALLGMHAALFTTLPEAAVHPYHRPADWRPHVKLANVRGGAGAAARLAVAFAEGWAPVNGRLEQLEAIQYPPLQSLWQARLKG
jgi:hypothetical protein